MQIPYKNKIILGISSLWILIPLLHLFHNIKHQTASAKIVALLLGLICISSYLFWFDGKLKSLYHNVDRGLVIIYICIVMMLNKNTYLSNDQYTFLYFDMIAIFFIGRVFYEERLYDLQLLFHCIFRYIAFWLGFIIINPNDHRILQKLFIITSTYILYMLSIYFTLDKMSITKDTFCMMYVELSILTVLYVLFIALIVL